MLLNASELGYSRLIIRTRVCADRPLQGAILVDNSQTSPTNHRPRLWKETCVGMQVLPMELCGAFSKSNKYSDVIDNATVTPM